MYKNMQEAGYKPDVITFGTLVSACVQGKDLARALTVSEEMESLGIKRNQVGDLFTINVIGMSVVHHDPGSQVGIECCVGSVVAKSKVFLGRGNQTTEVHKALQPSEAIL
jgi:pentatricopeptide repeat protein